MDRFKGKARVGVKVKTLVGGKSLNQNEELKIWSDRYSVFNKNLKEFLDVLRQHHSNMVKLGESKLLVANSIASMTRSTPLFEAGSVSSYLSIHNSLAAKTKSYSGKYSQFVVEYVEEWHKAVHGRVDKTLREAEKLRVEVDHYQAKVESLRQAANQTMAKGKQVDQKTAEKLTRNEEKLVKEKQRYNHIVGNACILVEELCGRGWRDLHPVLIKILQFDQTISSEEAKSMAGLDTVIKDLKKLAIDRDVKAEGRLRQIETADAAALSTADGTTTDGTYLLQIEAGMNEMSFANPTASATTSTKSDMHFPPGTTAPQGLGGFPVPITNKSSVSTNPTYPTATNTSQQSSSLSTMDMINISAAAAPPPSMDQLEAAFGNPGRSVASVGSFDSGVSLHSGPEIAVAPPPAAAPPMPPPTPQQGGGGGGGHNPFGPGPPSVAPPMPSYGGGGGPSPYPAPHTNPFGPGPPQPMAPRTAPPSSSYGQPAPAPGSYGAPPMPIHSNYAQAPAYNQQQQQYPPQGGYGQPPPPPQNQSTNPFDF